MLYVLPPWIGVVEFEEAVLFAVIATVWSLTEFCWSPYRLGVGVTTGNDGA